MQPLDESIVSDNGLLELSLAEGADSNVRGVRGETPMHVAARIGSVQAIEILLAHGAQPDLVDDMGSSPLMNAVGNGHAEAARRLLMSGARMSYCFTPDPTSPTQIELFGSVERSIRADNPPAYLKGMSEDLAAELWSLEHREQMIAGFREIHFRERDQNAISECHSLEMLKMLVDEFGADLDHVDPCGYWPLKSFAEADDLGSVQWLLEHGAKVDQTSTGETALFAAVYRDNLEMVRRLIAAGANVNQQDVDMCVPLSGCQSVAKAALLLEAGADPLITDQAGFPSWHFAKHPEVRQFISDAADEKRRP